MIHMLKETSNMYTSQPSFRTCSNKDGIHNSSLPEHNTNTAKSEYENVSEYSAYLQEKYKFLNRQTSMHGVPVTVNVSEAFLKKCLNDPEKMKFLESNLAVIPDCVKSAVNFTKTMPGNPTMTYASYSIDANGNISCMSGCTNDPDGKIARENAQKRAEEKKAEEKKAARRREEKKARDKKAEERMAEKRTMKESQYTVAVRGEHVESITLSLMDRISSSCSIVPPTAELAGFDTKA